MPGTAVITVSMQVNGNPVNNLPGFTDRTAPTAFNVPWVGTRGPAIGAILVPVHGGYDLNLSELILPGGFLWMLNKDPNNFVTYGIYDHFVGRFLPIGELKPNDPPSLFRMSRKLGKEYGTGTGTSLGPGDTIHLQADTAPVEVFVKAWDA